jgi:hypothetical protein
MCLLTPPKATRVCRGLLLSVRLSITLCCAQLSLLDMQAGRGTGASNDRLKCCRVAPVHAQNRVRIPCCVVSRPDVLLLLLLLLQG